MKNAASWLSVVLFAALLAVGYLALREKTEITQVDLRLGAAEKDTAKRVNELQHQLTEAKAALGLADKQLAAAASGSPATEPKRPNANGGATIVHIGDILKDHPEYTAMYAKQMRRNVDRMYGDSLSTLNLTPDQQIQLRNALAEKQMSSIDAQQAAEAAGLERGSDAWKDAMKQASQDVQQQINGLLGPNADNILAQMQTRVGFQNQVDTQFRTDFNEAGATLNPDQSRTLVAALADANYAGKDLSTRPAGYNDVDPNTGLSPHDNRIIDAAAKALSPAQVDVLKADQLESEKMAAMMRQYNKGGGPVMFVP